MRRVYADVVETTEGFYLKLTIPSDSIGTMEDRHVEEAFRLVLYHTALEMDDRAVLQAFARAAESVNLHIG